MLREARLDRGEGRELERRCTKFICNLLNQLAKPGNFKYPCHLWVFFSIYVSFPITLNKNSFNL